MLNKINQKSLLLFQICPQNDKQVIVNNNQIVFRFRFNKKSGTTKLRIVFGNYERFFFQDHIYVSTTVRLPFTHRQGQFHSQANEVN